MLVAGLLHLYVHACHSVQKLRPIVTSLYEILRPMSENIAKSLHNKISKFFYQNFAKTFFYACKLICGNRACQLVVNLSEKVCDFGHRRSRRMLCNN